MNSNISRNRNDDNSGEAEKGTGKRMVLEAAPGPEKKKDRSGALLTRRGMLEGLLAGGAVLGAGQLLTASAQTLLTQTVNTSIGESSVVGSDSPMTSALLRKPRKKYKRDKWDHDTATAKVYIDGLSIVCFDENMPTEFLFVADGHTPIELIVYRSDCPEPTSYPISEQVKIEIKRWKRTETQNRVSAFYEEENNTPNEYEDFRWLPDMCGWYNTDKLQFKATAISHLSGKLVIQDAIFYTKKKSRKDAILVGSHSPKTKVGRVVGADIICDPSDDGVIIEITGKQPIELPKLAGGLQYYIVVRTKALHGDCDDETQQEEAHDPMTAVYTYIIEPPTANTYYLKFEECEDLLDFKCAKDDFKKAKPILKFGKKTRRSTEYACQVHGVGNTVPPNFP